MNGKDFSTKPNEVQLLSERRRDATAAFLRRVPMIDRLAASDETIQRAAGFGTTLTTTDAQTIKGSKTFAQATLRFTDNTGTLIHGFGTTE